VVNGHRGWYARALWVCLMGREIGEVKRYPRQPSFRALGSAAGSKGKLAGLLLRSASRQ